MNVLFFQSAQNDGVGYHRLELPYAYLDMPNKRHRLGQLHQPDLEWADVLVISRVIDGNAWDTHQLCKQFGVKLVVDVDDLWILPRNHILHGYYQKTKYGEKQEQFLCIADQVWTTNTRLADEIKPFNTNVHIIPNALPYGDGQFNDSKNKSDRIRFFYAGGHTHKHDIALLSEVNRSMRKDKLFKEKGQFVLAGGFENKQDVYVDKIWEDMEKIYSGHAVKSATYKRLYGRDSYSYMDLYKDADVGLIPLEDNRFTMCKSNLKILECAAKKIPAIVSDVATYTDNFPPVLFASCENHFKIEIESFIEMPDTVNMFGQYLFDWAMEHHYLPTVNKLREKVLNSI